MIAFLSAASIYILPGNSVIATIETSKPYNKSGQISPLTLYKRSDHASSSSSSGQHYIVAPPSITSYGRPSSSTSFEVDGNRSPRTSCKGCLPGMSISNKNKERLNKMYSKSKNILASLTSQPRILKGRSGYDNKGYRKLGS